MATDRKRQLGVAATALSDDPRRVVAEARAAGFDGVLFDASIPAAGITTLSSTGRREFRHLLASHGQALIGLRADIGNRGLSPDADVDRIVDQIDRFLEAAAGVGCPLLCVDLGLLPAPPPSPPRPRINPRDAGLLILPESPPTAPAPAPQSSPDPAHVSLVDAALREIGQKADRYSMMLAMSASLSPLASLHEAIHRADCPWFGVNLDPLAVLQDEWSFEQTMDHLGRLVRHVRARDGQSGQAGRVQSAPVGRGSVDWGLLLRLLDEAGYRGALTVDPIDLPNRRSAALVGLAHLRLL